MTARLIDTVFEPLLQNELLKQFEDASIFSFGQGQLAITTDSYVVSPIFFPGGDIGSLSIHGTINDLAMRGASPLAISASFIIEEGLSLAELSSVAHSIYESCTRNNVSLIAADTKVVGRGAADKLFITTTGVGELMMTPAPSVRRAVPGDIVLVNGDIGRHGMAIMACREGIEMETTLLSDSASLLPVVQDLCRLNNHNVHCLRDITRGGLASVLNEIATSSGVGIELNEAAIPVQSEVAAICELLGLDPLYVACEGRFVAIVHPCEVDELMRVAARADNHLRDFRVIGNVVDNHHGRVVLKSRVGGNRIVDKLSGEQLPRIC